MKLFGVSRFWISRANVISDVIFQLSQHAKLLESLFGVMDVLRALVQWHVLQRILRPNLHKGVESRWVRQNFLELNTNSIVLAFNIMIERTMDLRHVLSKTMVQRTTSRTEQYLLVTVVQWPLPRSCYCQCTHSAAEPLSLVSPPIESRVCDMYNTFRSCR